jgi:hypothetical protein
MCVWRRANGHMRTRISQRRVRLALNSSSRGSELLRPDATKGPQAPRLLLPLVSSRRTPPGGALPLLPPPPRLPSPAGRVDRRSWRSCPALQLPCCGPPRPPSPASSTPLPPPLLGPVLCACMCAGAAPAGPANPPKPAGHGTCCAAASTAACCCCAAACAARAAGWYCWWCKGWWCAPLATP